FVDRPYRYFIHPKTFSKKGQAQTFAGLYRHLRASKESATASKIGSMIGIDVTRYLNYYTGGRNSGNVQDFVGSGAKGTSQAPDKYLRMLGALEKRREEPGKKWEYIGEPQKNGFPKKGN
ncbi:hypothetical protein FRC01_011375, partial [Tulasnella sp. 417]